MAGPKALLVDNDREMVRLMAAQLQAAGFQTFSAADGPSAIMLAQRQRPHVIVIDLGLPGGGGHLVMKRLKSLAPLAAVPIVVVTGKALDPDEEARVMSHAHSLHRKPVDFSDLIGALRAAVGRNPATG